MRGRIKWIAVGLALMLAVPALAKVTATRDAEDVTYPFLRAKLLREGKADFVVLPPDGRPTGHSNNRIAKFPRKGTHFTILSSGSVKKVKRKNKSEETSSDNEGPVIRGTRDLVMLRVEFKVPKGRNCLFFDFKFLSEEFPEFVDSEFNDAFVAELDKTTWDSRRDDSLVESPHNFALDSNGNPIRVNTVGNARVKRRFARGTTYDAATRTLRAKTRIDRGKHRLFLSIFDQGDRIYDSTVFLDGLRLAKRKNCKTGVVVAK